MTGILLNNDIQFIWAVFSGFKQEVPLDEILKYPLPFADGNTKFWDENGTIQHPLAELEIVSWDSSLLLLFSKEEGVVHKFKKHYPNTQDLIEYNLR